MESEKGHNELLYRTDPNSQTMKNLWFLKERGWGMGGCWAFGMEMIYNCTTINVINSLSNIKK